MTNSPSAGGKGLHLDTRAFWVKGVAAQSIIDIRRFPQVVVVEKFGALRVYSSSYQSSLPSLLALGTFTLPSQRQPLATSERPHSCLDATASQRLRACKDMPWSNAIHPTTCTHTIQPVLSLTGINEDRHQPNSPTLDARVAAPHRYTSTGCRL